MEPDTQWVCIREIQRSLKFSAKKLIEEKIKKFELGHLFRITLTEIRRIGYDGLIIFEGMQDHTADSIKSLEGFDGCWVEEAQNLSVRSLELLDPTMRKPGAELWFTWNPVDPSDPVEQVFAENDDAILVHTNYTDNPWCPPDMYRLADRQMKKDYEKYEHIWLGGYNTRSEAKVFKHTRCDEFEPQPHWDGPYYGMDFGFSTDPTCFVRCWINGNTLYIDKDAGKVGLELDDTARYFEKHDAKVVQHVIRADSARPESISYLKRHGLPKIVGVKKWSGSIEDGVAFIQAFDEVVIHPACKDMLEEARLYSYKVDKRTRDVLAAIEDENNHRWDAVRYALQPMISKKGGPRLRSL